MRTPPPPPFFRRFQLEQGHPDLQAHLLRRHRTRRLLAILSVFAFLGLAIGGAIYIATPQDARSVWRAPAAQPQVKTTAVTKEPGTVDLQVQKRNDTKTLRFHKVKDEWVIQDITPEAAPRKRFPWSKPAKPGS